MTLMMALQLGGSLLAILFLAWLAGRMGLGGDVRIRDEVHARELADDAICGFEPVDVALDRARIGALLRDSEGRIMLLRRHGAHFAARLLDSHAHIRLDQTRLELATADKRFGTVILDLGEQAQVWAASLRRMAV